MLRFTPNYDYNGRDGVMTDPNGLYQMRARYYNPEIKRFVNRDVLSGSIDDGLTMNRYAYVNGNPISYIDPFGLSADGDSWVTTGLSYGADAVPILGTVKGFQETITGVNYITGEQLSVADRVSNGIGSLTGLIPFPGTKYVGKYGTEAAIDAGGWVVKQFGKNTSKEVGSAYSNVYTSTRSLDNEFPELIGVNPNYVEGAGAGLNTNCVSCANVAQKRLLGEDLNSFASASNGYASKNDLLPSAPFGFLENLSAENVIRIMKAEESGAVGVVTIDQGKILHVINVVNKDGQVYFIDTQIGKIVELHSNLKLGLGRP
ncbi:RHS repeat-associated core domain-containing protein [Paenibacillus sp. PsM32]|uniref:RHS repeat-associated core domain-containing protein n=1 Tax=Paenibacillus sp. PsM32 TaxID=3030536 RepID=UPI00263AE0CD|nr:RHS repeat-associated core domain-containing protein [Paenibacillus sp. PsM32]MDN4621043.1 RHS repeat-associated core domain-containing protein [Paenibacillus sp. PsM32]